VSGGEHDKTKADYDLLELAMLLAARRVLGRMDIKDVKVNIMSLVDERTLKWTRMQFVDVALFDKLEVESHPACTKACCSHDECIYRCVHYVKDVRAAVVLIEEWVVERQGSRKPYMLDMIILPR